MDWSWKKAFDTIKKVITKETLLTYPNFNKPFEIYTDASKYQLGAVITQENKPVAFFTRKLTDAQTRYTTGEREYCVYLKHLQNFVIFCWDKKLRYIPIIKILLVKHTILTALCVGAYF